MTRVLGLSTSAAEVIRTEIERARGNEVCFVASVGDDGLVSSPRTVARGNARAVLAALSEAPAGSLAIHNHPSGVLDPSQADMRVAAAAYAQGLGFGITDNRARELYVVVEPPEVRPARPLDLDQVNDTLAPGGPMERTHGAYEDRPSQRAMAIAIGQSYNQGGVVLAEAGTGTGKSVAYLIPAVRWALQNRERTVVSTNTINLQEQLVRKDLPLLARVFSEPFRFALVKGRHNYVSIRRARLAAQTQSVLFDDPQQSALNAILEWINHTTDGSLQDLPFAPPPEVWDEVLSDSDVCLRARCPHFEQCFYQRSRREANQADIVVANHHLLFSDLAMRRTQDNYASSFALPSYRRVVMDEAHNLEDAATEHLGAAVSQRGLLRLLGRLERRGKGLLPNLVSRLLSVGPDVISSDAVHQIDNQLIPATEQARSGSTELFDRLAQLVANTDDGILRLTSSFSSSEQWIRGLDALHENALLTLDAVIRGLAQLRELLAMERTIAELIAEELLELNGVFNRLTTAANGLRVGFHTADDSQLVRWVERRSTAGDSNVVIRAAPVDLSDVMREALFDRVDTAVLTSATLATGSGFQFIRKRLGLGSGVRVQENVYDSPFDFEAQAWIGVPADLPIPGPVENPAFNRAIANVVADHVAAAGGGILALFTSYRTLRAVAADLRRRGLQQRWPLFVQGEAPRTRLLEQFVESGAGVLLGVNSFWEGVDVPGDPLRGIVLTRLPFKVPTEPLTAARIEAIEREGGNSFVEYLLPHAALRLKQGFGRLIRTRSDRGAIVILDRRLLERGYGKYFLEALPPAPVHSGAWAKLRLELAHFYQARTGTLAAGRD
jgi:ATP-dependent DNA helicase DinG